MLAARVMPAARDPRSGVDAVKIDDRYVVGCGANCDSDCRLHGLLHSIICESWRQHIQSYIVPHSVIAAFRSAARYPQPYRYPLLQLWCVSIAGFDVINRMVVGRFCRLPIAHCRHISLSTTRRCAWYAMGAARAGHLGGRAPRKP